MLVTVTGNVAVAVPSKDEGLIWSTTMKVPKLGFVAQRPERTNNRRG